jgi:hypothetical protein
MGFSFAVEAWKQDSFTGAASSDRLEENSPN